MRIMRMEIPCIFLLNFLEEEIKEIIEANDLATSPADKICSLQKCRVDIIHRKPEILVMLLRAERLKILFIFLMMNSYEVDLFKDYYVNSGLLSTIKTNNKA